MNVSEDFCSRMWQINTLEVILCTHWCMASLHCSHTFKSFFDCCFLLLFLNLQMLLLPAWYFFLFLVLVFFFNLLSLPLLSSFPFWLVEDVSNLTASDVMNRVNLGYLQGNLCAVYNSFATCEWLRPPCGERNLSFRQHPMKNSIYPPKRMLNCRFYLISLVI